MSNYKKSKIENRKGIQMLVKAIETFDIVREPNNSYSIMFKNKKGEHIGKIRIFLCKDSRVVRAISFTFLPTINVKIFRNLKGSD